MNLLVENVSLLFGVRFRFEGKENAPALEEMEGAETLIAEESRSFKDGRVEIAPTATGDANSATPCDESAVRSESTEMRGESAEIAPESRQEKKL